MNLRDEEHLEKLTRAAFRDLPLRRAPASLQERVLAAIAQRRAGPWWRHGYAHWPVLARCAFVGLSLALMGAGVWALDGMRPANVTEHAMFAWERIQALTAVASTLGNAAGLVIHHTPRWFFGFLTLSALANAILFGLGAAAYRVLQSSRDNPL